MIKIDKSKKKDSKTVSIITPSYNQASFIEETILSVINQTYKNIEYIVIDGGSADNTLAVIGKYRNFISILICEKDGGQADAINKGLRLASGDFITWINSDDTLAPNAIQLAVDYLSADTDCEFVYGDIKLIDNKSKIISELKGVQIHVPRLYWEMDLGIPQQGAVWKRSVTNRIGLLNERWNYVLDRDFFLRICLAGKAVYIPSTLGYFRQHDNSKSVSQRSSWITEIPMMYDFLTNEPAWEFSKKITKIVRASSRIHAAYLAFSSGKCTLGCDFLFKAFSIDGFIFFRLHIYKKLIYKVLKNQKHKQIC